MTSISLVWKYFENGFVYSNKLKYIFPVKTDSNLINFFGNDPTVNYADELNSKEEDIPSGAIIRLIYSRSFKI